MESIENNEEKEIVNEGAYEDALYMALICEGAFNGRSLRDLLLGVEEAWEEAPAVLGDEEGRMKLRDEMKALLQRKLELI